MTEIQNYNICQKAIDLKDTIEKNFLTLGLLLKDIRDNRRYSQEAFWCFCEEDMKFSESKASRLIKVIEVMLLGWKWNEERIIKIGGWDSAYLIASTAKDQKEGENMYEKGETADGFLPPSEYRKIVSEHKQGVECKHTDTYMLKICRKCGYKEKMYND